jgi:predicted enzyme related to lactoylglutathione lyase
VAGDLADASAFYSGLFGWEPGETFTLDGLAVAGVRPGAPDQPSTWMTYLATEDAEATAGAVAGAGGSVLMPPTDIGPRGRMAMLSDAEGAVFGVWQRGTLYGAQATNQPGTVCWSEMVTRDLSVATDFYGKAFDWSARDGELAEGMPYHEWMCAGRVVAGMAVMDEHYPADVPAHWRTTFAVDNLDETMARCTTLGGQALFGPLDVVVGFYGQLMDRQGGYFGVIELSPELRDML